MIEDDPILYKCLGCGYIYSREKAAVDCERTHYDRGYYKDLYTGLKIGYKRPGKTYSKVPCLCPCHDPNHSETINNDDCCDKLNQPRPLK